jgi:flagellar biosynthesis/type III secretory pathway M-ring protein FliF/YscJ
MRTIDKIIYSIIGAVVVGLSAIAIKFFHLDYENMFSNITVEHITFFVFVIFLEWFLIWDILRHRYQKKQGELKAVIDENKNQLSEIRKQRDSYKSELELRDKEDLELEDLRTILRYKNEKHE